MQPRGVIHLDQASRLWKKRPFSLMIKPVGNFCNLNCSYCYYSPSSYSQGRMSDELLRESMYKVIDHNESDEISICWHGGEPLLAGLDFYEKALDFQREALKAKGSLQKISNSLQTNGTLIDRKWASFFRENHFLTGISLDGPPDIHNAFRLNIAGLPLFDKTMEGLGHLIDHGVEFNTLSTVNACCKGRGAEVYGFLRDSGSRFMQFLPVVSPGKPWGINALDYGIFMMDIFDQWWENHDAGRYYVQLFDVTLANYMSMEGGLCQFSPVCGDVPVVEMDGKLYACDHFVSPEHLLGSITDEADSLIFNGKLPNFGIGKFSSLPKRCLNCKHLKLCYGGCPEHRIVNTADGRKLNYLCEGYTLFFDHIQSRLKEMSDYIRSL